MRELPDEDQRKKVTGMWIKSYTHPKLVDIATYLKIQKEISLEEYDKEQLGQFIEEELRKRNLILR